MSAEGALQARSLFFGTRGIRSGLITLAVLVLMTAASWSWAQANRATVRIDGNAVFQLTADSRQEARERADQIEERLLRILEASPALTPVRITVANGMRNLAMGERHILTVSQEDAAWNESTVDELAGEWAAVLDKELGRAAERRVSGWGRFRVQTQASVGNAFSRMLESAIVVIPRLLSGILVLLVFWALASAIRWLMRLVFSRIRSDETVENLFNQVAYYSVWLIGLIVATNAVGYDPQALATGLGLTGVALGFALKDILSNFVSGVLILALRPFKIGDQIVIGATEGAVEQITLRATRIRTYDGRAVLVPNGEVFTSRVTNNTESPVRRGCVEVPISYEPDLRKTVDELRDAVQHAQGVLQSPPASLRIEKLGATEILLEARFWTDSRRSDFTLTASRVRAAIIEYLKSARIDADDSQVRVKNEAGPEER